jgi:hypothetical protein
LLEGRATTVMFLPPILGIMMLCERKREEMLEESILFVFFVWCKAKILTIG